MRPVNLTSATRRGARHDQQDMPAERGVGTSSQRKDPDDNTQLTENLRRPPVREARLREPNVPIGVQVANVGRQAARVGTVMASASVIPSGLIALQAPLQQLMVTQQMIRT